MSISLCRAKNSIINKETFYIDNMEVSWWSHEHKALCTVSGKEICYSNEINYNNKDFVIEQFNKECSCEQKHYFKVIPEKELMKQESYQISQFLKYMYELRGTDLIQNINGISVNIGKFFMN